LKRKSKNKSVAFVPTIATERSMIVKVAVSATGPGLDSEVDPRFGRCQYFVLVDPDTLENESIENASAIASGGAGIAAAQMVADKGVEAVLTGNCGPNAHQTLAAAGVKIITGASGTVKEAAQAYKEGRLQATDQPTVDAHFGTGGGAGMAGGAGRGMGGGMGRGMGMRGYGTTPGAGSQFQSTFAPQELSSLKTEFQSLSQQVSDIQRRLEALEKKAE
jgi:predicted Fe-Mo cluster-binding NifX family protein